MKTLLQESRERRDKRAMEVAKLGRKFSIPIDYNSLSMAELNDLAELDIGETTCIIIDNTAPDVTRIA
jgi:hypothetical protein